MLPSPPQINLSARQSVRQISFYYSAEHLFNSYAQSYSIDVLVLTP